MAEQVRLTAFLVGNQIDVKGIKTFLDIKPLADSSAELFYGFSPTKFQYYTNYGTIVFTGYTEEEMKYAIKAVNPYVKEPIEQPLRDEFQIRFDPASEMIFNFNEVIVPRLDEKVIRIAMIHLSQSMGLDYYNSIGEKLLEEVKLFTNQLESSGTLKISRKNMMRFLGRALNTQNNIAGNIYIFDAPELTWEDEFLDKFYQELIKQFDLRVRFSEVEYTLKIIENNLSVFREIIHQRESSMLEVIIIALILVEVFDLFISRLL